MLQAFLVAPGLALAFLVAAPVGLWPRIWKLMVGAIALIVSSGWYVALVSLWPAQSRPYIGGSPENSLLQLALGYNGIERMVGRSGGGPGGGDPGGGSLGAALGAVREGAQAVPGAGHPVLRANPASAGCSGCRWVPRRPGCFRRR
jgi:4-amino-4-deoxy-L-arabinose transferase-like glycosyltransferase